MVIPLRVNSQASVPEIFVQRWRSLVLSDKIKILVKDIYGLNMLDSTLWDSSKLRGQCNYVQCSKLGTEHIVHWQQVYFLLLPTIQMTLKLHLWKNVHAMKISLDLIHRHCQDFSKGGVTLCQSEGTRLFGHFQAETSWHFRHLF